MGNFSEEPEGLVRRKWVMLVIETFAVAIFALEYICAWAYPIVNSNFNKFVVFHILHAIILLGVVVLRNSTISHTPAFGVIIGFYVICVLVDLAGCISRTIYFHQSHLSRVSFEYVFGMVLVVLEWILPLFAVIQVILLSVIAQLTAKFLESQDYIIAALIRAGGEFELDSKTRSWMEIMERKLGMSSVAKPGEIIHTDPVSKSSKKNRSNSETSSDTDNTPTTKSQSKKSSVKKRGLLSKFLPHKLDEQ